MQIKILEVRDCATLIPMLCIDMNEPANEAQRWYMRRMGYPLDGRPNIAITHLRAGGDPLWNDPYGWRGGARTYPVAHEYIIEHWTELRDGDVVCVETIAGERDTPKISERLNDDALPP
jgi:hypothetical protein